MYFNPFSFIHVWALQKRKKPFREELSISAWLDQKISRPVVLVETEEEEESERWWSKHKSVEEWGGAEGEWRGRTEIRHGGGKRRGPARREVTRADLYWSPQTASLSALTGHAVNSQPLPPVCGWLCVYVCVCAVLSTLLFKCSLVSDDGFNPVLSGLPDSRTNSLKETNYFNYYWITVRFIVIRILQFHYS